MTVSKGPWFYRALNDEKKGKSLGSAHSSQNILLGALEGFKPIAGLKEPIVKIVKVIDEALITVVICFIGRRGDVKRNQEILSNTVNLVDPNVGPTVKEIELFQGVFHLFLL